jgi:WXXGXW repeat (2 copies)
MLLLLLSVAVGVEGCGGGYYASGAAYGPGPYYGSGYAGSTSVVVAVQDRPYYTHGPGYYVGRTYYAWRPGHWSRRGYWVPGHYVLVSR